MATPLRRHRDSLTGLLPRPGPPLLTLEETDKARTLFCRLIQYASGRKAKGCYDPVELINQTFQHIQCTEDFLYHFFRYVYSDMVQPGEGGSEAGSSFAQAYEYVDKFQPWNLKCRDETLSAIDNYAGYLIDNLYLPLKASFRTPQPTPTALSSWQNTPLGTRSRVSKLRQECLFRDHHRCVVSQAFDRGELKKRLDDNNDSTDDDGHLLKDLGDDDSDYLEVAHIIPHSLTSLSSDEPELSESKRAAHDILAMFDPDVVHMIESQDIDSPKNALTLTQKYHRLFGEFEIYFEPTGTKYEYKIDSTEQRAALRNRLFPVVRQICLSPKHTVDPPSAQLLAVHGAVARILKLSAAGEYIENILRDMENLCVKDDGSTDLGRLVKWGLGGVFKFASAGITAN